MAIDGLQESSDLLTVTTRDTHRALASLMEELDAIDRYRQRADACSDARLQDIFLHNRNEEIEHASMLLEWIRRQDGHLDAMLRKFLFTTQPIVAIETGQGMGVVVAAATPERY